MKRRLVLSLFIFALIVSLTGCATMEEHKGATVGAVLGATAGVLLGGDTEGRVVGGLIGALVGGAIGHYAYDQNRTREETVNTYNYQPSQGSIVTIEKASASPEVVSPGDIVEIRITYAVLNPSSEMETSLTEIREITHNGELVGKPEATVSRTSGTYTSTIPIRLPENSGRGIYDVRTIVQSQNAKDERQVTFTVQ
jgi:hypothetical protein